MVQSRHIVIACISLLILASCHGGEIYRTVNIDGGKGASIDARQRLIFVTEKGGRTGNQRIVCAEPSPDVAVAAAESLAANLKAPASLFGGGNGDLAGGIAAARSESLASIAFRTQTIQLLRDALYRACEAYMNGAINDFQYQVIIANMDRLMPALIAVDGLTYTQAAAAIAVAATAPPVSASPEQVQVQQTQNAEKLLSISEGKQDYVAAGAFAAKSVRDIVAIMNDRTSIPVLCMSLYSDQPDANLIDQADRKPSHRVPSMPLELKEFCYHIFAEAIRNGQGGAYTDKIDFTDTTFSAQLVAALKANEGN